MERINLTTTLSVIAAVIGIPASIFQIVYSLTPPSKPMVAAVRTVIDAEMPRAAGISFDSLAGTHVDADGQGGGTPVEIIYYYLCTRQNGQGIPFHKYQLALPGTHCLRTTISGDVDGNPSFLKPTRGQSSVIYGTSKDWPMRVRRRDDVRPDGVNGNPELAEAAIVTISSSRRGMRIDKHESAEGSNGFVGLESKVVANVEFSEGVEFRETTFARLVECYMLREKVAGVLSNPKTYLMVGWAVFLVALFWRVWLWRSALELSGIRDARLS
jgi:hypothetical protein